MDSEKLHISIKPMETEFPVDVYKEIVDAVIKEVNNSSDPDETIHPYLYPIENIQKIAESDNLEYKEGIRSMADELWNQEDWINSLLVYYILMHVIKFLPTDFYKLAYTFGKLGYNALAEKIVPIYEKFSPNKKVACHALANFYYTSVDSPFKAIAYFEKYLQFDPENANVYLTLSHLYSRIEDEVSRQKQLDSLMKADSLKPNDPLIVKGLLTFYEKRHDEEKVKELYPKLISISPSPRHSMNYGLYLMSWGRIQEGGKYFAERFDLEQYPVGYPKGVLTIGNRWNFTDDISDKLLVVHYEEGFGDSIMYARFLPLIKQYARKTVLILQEELANLFRQSTTITEGIEIFTNIKDFVSKYKGEKYVHIPMMDLPYPLGVDSCFIPYAKGYLKATKPKSFDNKKLNIGIAYSGDLTANYEGRDIGVESFYNLAKLDNVQLYSLQVGETAKQLLDAPKDVSIIDLGKDFKDFTDTADAIMGLDLVITTDNVILNLAGALGKMTIGLFNKYPNFRWFNLTGDDVVWYESVSPMQCQTENNWAPVISELEQIVSQIKKNG